MLFELAFFSRQDPVTDPLVELLDDATVEQWSETEGLTTPYHLDDAAGPLNYIGWLLRAPIADVKAQTFRGDDGESRPVPDALLYRYLRRALLLAYHDTTTRLFEAAGTGRRPRCGKPSWSTSAPSPPRRAGG